MSEGQKEIRDGSIELGLKPSAVESTNGSKSQLLRPMKRRAQFPHIGCTSSHCQVIVNR